MHEETLKNSLHQIVDGCQIPDRLWNNIQIKLDNKKIKSRRLKKFISVAVSLVLITVISLGSITSVGANIKNTFLFHNKLGTVTLNLVQSVGQHIAGISPTLFLPTTLEKAKNVAKMSIKTPSYLPKGIVIDSNTPTLVGRFGDKETVAIKVLDPITYQLKGEGEVILLDIRQSTANKLDVYYPPDVKIETQKVKINNYDGLLVIEDGLTHALYWTDDKYSYRMFGPRDYQELIKIAESMK